MRRVHCAGCGATEPEGLPHNQSRISQVRFDIEDRPARSWEHGQSFAEDLCDDCIEGIVRKFFKTHREPGEIPTFLRAVGG